MIASKTTEVKYAKRGARGQLPYPAGIYSPNIRYTASENIAPYVLFQPDTTSDGTRYVMNKVVSWLGTDEGITPAEDYARNGNNATWIPFEHFNAIEIDLALIRFGKIGSAVFYDDYMFSQYGTDSLGNDVDGYKDFNPSDPMDPDNSYCPNVLVDWRKGESYFRKAILYECQSVGQNYMYLQSIGRQYCPIKSNIILLDAYNGANCMLYVPTDKSGNCNPNWNSMQFKVMNVSKNSMTLYLSQPAPLTVNRLDTGIDRIVLAPSRCVDFVFVAKRNSCGLIIGSGGMACQAGTFYLTNVYDFSIQVDSDSIGGYSSVLSSLNLNSSN